MNYKYTISTAIIGLSIAFLQPQVARAICSNSQVDATAEKITVLIDSQEPGSGVIIKKEGNTYTVLTAYHVVKNQNFKYTIVTPDEQRYTLNYQTVKQLSNKIDLAVLQFTSNKDYQVAKLGNSDTLTRRTNVYVAGFPKATAAVKLSIYDCRGGQVIANATQITADNGYNLIYDNATLFGMSGGAVLNDQEEVIGIHGRGEESSDVDIDKINSSVATVKSGRNSGIPINTFLRLSAKSGVDVGITPPLEKVATAPKADDFFIQGVDKRNKGDNQGAILAYNEAIRLNPNFSEAYYNRGLARYYLGDKKAAIADYNQAIKINPKDAEAYTNRGVARSELGDKEGALTDFNQALKINPNYTNAYTNRGVASFALGDKQAALTDFNQSLKINRNDAPAYINRGNFYLDLGDKQAAIADYNQAIKINPNLAEAYNNRGIARSDLGDKQAAIADYNQALKINPNYAEAYNNRGITRSDLGNKQAAIADFNQALKINPNLAQAYYVRGAARSELGDKQAAIDDYSQALKINPNYDKAYYDRGVARSELGDKQAAIDDYNQALKINPNLAQAYYGRGYTRYDLGDKQGAISDFQQAANIFQEQGNLGAYQMTLENIRKIQQQ